MYEELKEIKETKDLLKVDCLEFDLDSEGSDIPFHDYFEVERHGRGDTSVIEDYLGARSEDEGVIDYKYVKCETINGFKNYVYDITREDYFDNEIKKISRCWFEIHEIGREILDEILYELEDELEEIEKQERNNNGN